MPIPRNSLKSLAVATVLAAALCLTAHAVQVVHIAPRPGSPDNHSAPTLYDAGCRRLASGQTADAIELLSQAVSADPAALAYQLKLSEAYVAGHRADAARRLLERTFAQHAEHFPTRAALARLYAEAAEPQRVEALLGPFEKSLDPESLLALSHAVAREPPRARAARAMVRRGVRRFPKNLPLRLALIDADLADRRFAGALRAVASAEQNCGRSPALHFRAAQAYFELGQLLGDVQVREIRDGRAGQFSHDWLLVESRDDGHAFLCCPRKSALYQLRRALDAGLDTAEAHLMHAQIWQRIGKPEVGFAIVKSHEALWLENPTSEVLEVLARLALEADALSDFARYARVQARLDPEHSRRVIKHVYLELAKRFNQRGDDQMYAKCLDRAARLDPDDVDLAMRRAEATWSAGRRDDAVNFYRHVLELDPDHPQRQHIIERLGQRPSPKRDPG